MGRIRCEPGRARNPCPHLSTRSRSSRPRSVRVDGESIRRAEEASVREREIGGKGLAGLGKRCQLACHLTISQSGHLPLDGGGWEGVWRAWCPSGSDRAPRPPPLIPPRMGEGDDCDIRGPHPEPVEGRGPGAEWPVCSTSWFIPRQARDEKLAMRCPGFREPQSTPTPAFGGTSPALRTGEDAD